MEQGTETGPKLLGVADAATYVGVSSASLRKWSDQGLLRVYRTPGGQRRYAVADLDEFIGAMLTRASGNAPRRQR
jgi:excisionase family DNA binding protein